MSGVFLGYIWIVDQRKRVLTTVEYNLKLFYLLYKMHQFANNFRIKNIDSTLFITKDDCGAADPAAQLHRHN